MWWQTVIIDVLSVTSVLSIIAMIRFWKQNKRLKDNEVKKDNSEVKVSEVDAQKAQIELGEMFTQKSIEMFQKMQELQEQTYKATMKNGLDNESIIAKIEKIEAEQLRQANEIKRLADEQGHIVTFVNGEYQDFLRKNGFKRES